MTYTIGPPSFRDHRDYLDARRDLERWKPIVIEVARRHGLDAKTHIEATSGGTHPSFLLGDVIIKCFGHASFATRSHHAELDAHRVLRAHPEVLAPRLLAHGRLFEDENEPWFYLVTERVEGKAWDTVEMSRTQRITVAEQLGEQLHHVREIPGEGLSTIEDWSGVPDITSALEESAFPAHLVDQVPEFMDRSKARHTRSMVHGDLVANHIFVDEQGNLSAIIDWGDALSSSPYHDIGKLFFHTLGRDRELLSRCLMASRWPFPAEEFSGETLRWLFTRQALGLAQHHSFDVFNHLPPLLGGRHIDSLDELAAVLFAPVSESLASFHKDM